MRLLQLELIAYGPFTDATIDLSQGDQGLHVIYGLNEAGKSCALRALTHLFFGIPKQTTDNFLHEHPQLRIGARIRHSDGRALHFIRRKGLKKTLINADGEALDDQILGHYLGDVGRKLFTHLFGLDSTALVRGGEALIAGEGDLGQSLFAAGMGVAGMRHVVSSLENEAAALFKPYGKKPLINQLIHEFKAVQKERKAKSLSSKEYTRHRRLLKEAETAKQAIEDAWRAATSQINRLERFQKAIPRIDKRRAVYEQLNQLGDVVPLPDGFSEQRQKVQDALNQARAAKERLSKELAAIVSEIERIAPDPALIQHRQEIQAQYLHSGSYHKAQLDLPELRNDYKRLQNEARAILNKIGFTTAFEEIEQLRLPESKITRIREFSHKKDAFDERRRAALKEIQKTETQLAGANRDLDSSPPVRDDRNLAKALARAQKKGDLNGQLEELQKTLEAREKKADRLLQRIGLWKGSLAQLEKFAAPAEETVLRFDAVFTETDAQLRQIRKLIADAKVRNLEIENAILTMQGAGTIPTQAQLQNARQHREDGWRLIRNTWLAGRLDEAGVRAFIGVGQGPVDASALAEAYQHAVHKADGISDRLYSESERAARLAGLSADRKQGVKKVAAHETEFSAAKRSRRQLEKEWQELWRPLGLSPLPPREMLAWLQNHRALINLSEDMRRIGAEIERIREQITYHRADLTRCLAQCRASGGAEAACNPEQEEPSADPSVNPDEHEPLDRLIDRCALEVKAIEKNRNHHLILKERINDLKVRLAIAQQDLRQAEKEQSRWRRQWGQSVACIGLTEQALPEEAESVLHGLQQLFEHVDQAQSIQGRIQAINADADNFQHQVKRLCQRIGRQFDAEPPDEIIAALQNQLNQALTDAARRDELEKQRHALAHRVAEETSTLEKMTLRMDDLRGQAGGAAVEALPEIENRFARAREYKAQIDQLESELAEYSAGAELDAFIREAADMDVDALAAEIDARQRQIEELNEKRSQADQTIGSAAKTLESMDGGMDASVLAEQAQAITAELNDAVDQYAVARLASAVLLKAIEKYRDTHQGALLKRAGAIFRRLTLNRYQGLAPDYDEKDNPMLMGVRSSGAKVPIQGMSSGTADQLYLALRLAAIEQRQAASEPLPLILDDVLVNFDDHRAKAALDVLAEFSHNTQIIFFTHHRHLVAMAEAHCDGKVLFCHELNETGAGDRGAINQ